MPSDVMGVTEARVSFDPVRARDHYIDEDRLIAALVGLAIAGVVIAIAAFIDHVKAHVVWW